MEKYFKISRQLGISIVANVLIFISVILRTALLTRRLSVDVFGMFSVFFVSVSFFSVVLDLGLTNFIITKLTGVREKKRFAYSSTILGFVVFYLVLAGILICSLGIDTFILNYFQITQYLQEFRIIIWVIILSVIFRIMIAYTSSIKRLELNALLTFLKHAGWIFLLLIFGFKKDLTLLFVFQMLLAGVLTSTIVTLIYVLLRWKRVPAVEVWRDNSAKLIMKKALLFGLPLVPFLVGDWLIQVSDKYLLTYLGGAADVAIYSVAYSIVTLISSIGNILAGVIYPYYSESWNKKKDPNHFFNINLKYILMILLPMIVGIFVLRKPIVTLISGPEYLDSALLIPILLLFPLFSTISIVLNQTLMLNNQTKRVGAIYLFCAAAHILLNVLLIPIYGRIGTAVVTTSVYFLLFIILLSSVWKVIEIRRDFVRFGRIISAALVMGLFVSLINPTNAVAKVLTISLGSVIYLINLFIFKVFTTSELDFMRNVIKRRENY